jgi:patatin-like phospholipase/acyl hydrolase
VTRSDVPASGPIYRVLALDGGGIKGVFTASVLADFEETLGESLVEYFDLISGTSTGGIIALGLGLGLSAHDILAFYQAQGPMIFNGARGLIGRFLGAKYDSRPLKEALESVFGDHVLGTAKTRLVIPATNLETGEVHIFKTAHHERFERDYKERVVDVALATAAAPTYFRTHRLPAGTPLMDGGIWANNPMGAAAVEALGVLDWPKGSVKLLSIGCTESAPSVRDSSPAGLGLGKWAQHLVNAFMYAQSSASIGTATHLLGPNNVHRISKIVGGGRYKLDGVKEIESLRGLGSSVAREEYPKVKAMFLAEKAQPFVPLREVTP